MQNLWHIDENIQSNRTNFLGNYIILSSQKIENIASIKIMYNNIIYAESASVRRSTLYIHNCENVNKMWFLLGIIHIKKLATDT